MKTDSEFSHEPGTRVAVPLFIGLSGAPASGKTYSALRLASGIQSVVGGPLFVVDTESRRARHYGDKFSFEHVDFGGPFGSLRYLRALRYCVEEGARVIVVDSMSMEHEGEGGYLQTHNLEMQRMSGGDPNKAMRVQMAAWIKPSAERRALINGLLQLNANFIFCFRAKEKVKPRAGQEPEDMGYQPIAGIEFLFEQTVNILLMPGSNGIPTWETKYRGERELIKLPEQFRTLFSGHGLKPLDESIGEALARWSLGGTPHPAPSHPPPMDAAHSPPRQTFSPAEEGPLTPERFSKYDHLLNDAARQCTPETGMSPLREAFMSIPEEHREGMRPALERRHKVTARALVGARGGPNNEVP